LSGGRFILGPGAGENLNEHAPRIPRHEIGNGRLGGKVEENLADAQQERREHQPHQVHLRGQDQHRESDQDGAPAQIGPHHHPPAVQPVHHDTGVQREQHPGNLGRHDDAAQRYRTAGAPQDQQGQRTGMHAGADGRHERGAEESVEATSQSHLGVVRFLRGHCENSSG
jgi:hypothetical protein